MRVRQVYGSSSKYSVVEGNIWVEIRNADTHELLVSAVFTNSNLSIRDSDVLSRIELQTSEPMGDIITALPSPSAVVLWGMGGGTFPALIYNRERTVVTIDTPIIDSTHCLVITGHEPIQTITIFSALPSDDDWGGYIPQTWQSFGRCYQWKELAPDD